MRCFDEPAKKKLNLSQKSQYYDSSFTMNSNPYLLSIGLNPTIPISPTTNVALLPVATRKHKMYSNKLMKLSALCKKTLIRWCNEGKVYSNFEERQVMMVVKKVPWISSIPCWWTLPGVYLSWTHPFWLSRIEDLQSTAGHFRRGANQVRKRMWWKDLKWKIIIAVTIIAILGIIIGKQWTYNNNQAIIPFIKRSLRLGSIVGTQV